MDEYISSRQISPVIRRLALNLKEKWEHIKSQRTEHAIEEAEDDEGNLNDDEESELRNDRYAQYRRMLKRLEAYKR